MNKSYCKQDEFHVGASCYACRMNLQRAILAMLDVSPEVWREIKRMARTNITRKKFFNYGKEAK